MWSELTVPVTVPLFCLTAPVLWIYLNYLHNYWIRHNVPQITPLPLVGNLGKILSMAEPSAKVIEEFYNHPKAEDKPFVGIYVFYRPAILLREPELIKRILVRDFPKFSNRFSCSDIEGDPLGSQNLFMLKNPAWKDIRFKLTPFFTSGKLKQMFPLIAEVGENLNKYLLKFSTSADSPEFELELKEFCALYTTDVIATVAFGVQANSFENPNGQFRRNGREIFRFNKRRAINFSVVFFLPHLVPYFGAKVVPDEQTEFLRSTFNYVVAEREKSGKIRHDLIDILIEFKNSSKCIASKNGEVKFDGDLLVAQAAIFFTAGFESSSATMSFALYELARNPEIQERVREEVRTVLINSGGKLTLRNIESLEYMQMVISETLRLYPPLPFLDRECTVEKDESYLLEPFSSFSIPKGMPIYIPAYALHMDPKVILPEPQTFNPERFSPENRKNITPYSYMPFGLGPHACIGERFAYLQNKGCETLQFLRNHRVTLSPKNPHRIKLDPKALILQSEGGIVLNVQRDPLQY
ncbi:LOW QUALITY PROTEIN: probable cytochrome P450 6g2 [Musca vetustissima]|uniref:LOW QUALITY PROTEIN: probable cytochrome P450 6g2 n=1 Tax=Musca vetustissima TaxID=27455 RepID=UPI002AB66625|nr:LOW QUALITY PROTEIN: probable cytochrome P450 6g2 [Musca vetustissima]